MYKKITGVCTMKQKRHYLYAHFFRVFNMRSIYWSTILLSHVIKIDLVCPGVLRPKMFQLNAFLPNYHVCVGTGKTRLVCTRIQSLAGMFFLQYFSNCISVRPRLFFSSWPIQFYSRSTVQLYKGGRAIAARRQSSYILQQ